jgi:hypothetical protein
MNNMYFNFMKNDVLFYLYTRRLDALVVRTRRTKQELRPRSPHIRTVGFEVWKYVVMGIWKISLLACLCMTANLSAAPGESLRSDQEAIFKQHPDLLFLIERDLNKNVILYLGEGEGQSASVKSHWLNLEEGPNNTSPILDREKKAYGYSVRNGKMKMNPLPGLDISLDYSSKLNRPAAYIIIDGQKARLVRIFFEVNYKLGFIPYGAKYFDLHAIEVNTSRHVKQRITPR